MSYNQERIAHHRREKIEGERNLREMTDEDIDRMLTTSMHPQHAGNEPQPEGYAVQSQRVPAIDATREEAADVVMQPSQPEPLNYRRPARNTQSNPNWYNRLKR